MIQSPLTLLAVVLCLNMGMSQDLIKRTQRNIPADISYSPNIVADQIYHKKDLETIDLFSLSSDKSSKLDGVQLSICLLYTSDAADE